VDDILKFKHGARLMNDIQHPYYSSPEQELEVHIAGSSVAQRNERNIRLQQSDWVVVKAQEEGTEIPQEWRDYRQALRDITTADGWPLSHQWPEKPL
jgi:hypothetical protein